MRCEDVRRALRGGDLGNAVAAHLEQCRNCFAAFEEADRVIGVLRAARPSAVEPSALFARRVLGRWHPPAVSSRRGLVAAGALALLALGVTGVGLWFMPELAGQVIAGAGLVGGVLEALVAGARGVLFGNPLVLASYLAFTVGLCVLWGRLYQRVLSRTGS